jgi:repressor of nif and glnA expression
MVETKKERYRRIRGAILKLLAHQHPGPLDIKEIHFLLDDMGFSIPEEELRSHLSYLSEGKLLIHGKRKSGGIQTEMIVITRDGLNILDGFGPGDVGIDIRF